MTQRMRMISPPIKSLDGMALHALLESAQDANENNQDPNVIEDFVQM
jgi:hypothetical protein